MGYLGKIRRVTPYIPGEQPKTTDVIKLNTNENPYPPSPEVSRVIKDFDAGLLRLYPDPEASLLVEALADYHKVRPGQVFVGVGSDDVLAMAFQTFFNSDHPVLFPDITYSFYDVWCELFGIDYKCVPLDMDFRIDPAAYDMPSGGVIFPNPNAPTGIYESLDVVRGILDRNPDSIVIVDEAYVDYAPGSALELLDDYPQLVVVRTFSKSRSMAGVRIGYAVASEELIGFLNDVKFSFNSYTMSSLTLAMGKASVEDDAYFRSTVGKVKSTREWTVNALEKLGFSCLPSGANFVFAKHESAHARDIFDAARQKGIYLRYFPKPRIDEYLRITIGTDEQMKRMTDFLGEYLNV